MFYGQRESGENVFASAELIGETVFCPICQSKLQIKKSSRGRYFFVHYQKCQKDYGEGSKHRFWKQRILEALSNQGAREEVVFANRRRGDIYIEVSSSVVEIQFSTISVDELARRIDDYESLNLKQFWVFQWPNIKKDTLVLSPMALYIWQKTDLPLIYINTKNQCLYVITQLQFTGNRRAFFEYQKWRCEDILQIRRHLFKKSIAHTLQNRWLKYYHRTYKGSNERNKRYRTKLAQQLYYLSNKGIREETLGKGYTANVFFVTSPVVWQTECLYLYMICQKSVSECAIILKCYMIKASPDAEIIVQQLLEQFLEQQHCT